MPELTLRGGEVDGLGLHYEVAGRGPAVVLVHGLGGFGASWRHTIEALASRATVYAVDLPGFGRSGKPRTHYRLGYFARALREAGLAHVVTDAPAVAGAMPHVTAVTAPTAVMRLHGRNAEGWMRQLRGEEPAVREKYDYLYSEAELRELMPEIDEAADEAEQVYVSFNNNNRDYPVRNALMLKRLLGQPHESLPGDLFA